MGLQLLTAGTPTPLLGVLGPVPDLPVLQELPVSRLKNSRSLELHVTCLGLDPSQIARTIRYPSRVTTVGWKSTGFHTGFTYPLFRAGQAVLHVERAFHT